MRVGAGHRFRQGKSQDRACEIDLNIDPRLPESF